MVQDKHDIIVNVKIRLAGEGMPPYTEEQLIEDLEFHGLWGIGYEREILSASDRGARAIILSITKEGDA
jgi:hypothetical protein